jgi:TctA family transporter
MMEEYLRRGMLLSRGDPLILLQRPISATILAVAALPMAVVLTPAIHAKRTGLPGGLTERRRR